MNSRISWDYTYRLRRGTSYSYLDCSLRLSLHHVNIRLLVCPLCRDCDICPSRAAHTKAFYQSPYHRVDWVSFNAGYDSLLAHTRAINRSEYFKAFGPVLRDGLPDRRVTA